MDSLISAAARALALGDALTALSYVSLREDPPALALRGIAMAQLGEYPRARELLRRAARGFGTHEPMARARCVVAEAEVALAMRELNGSPRILEVASAVLEAHADNANASHARLIAVRRLILLGRLDDATAALAHLDTSALPPALRTGAELASAEVALRSMHIAPAQASLARAQAAAERSGVPALLGEVALARTVLELPAARRITPGREQLLSLVEVEKLLSSGALVIDACRRGIRAGAHWQTLARRPVLFALARTLAAAWPGDVDRQTLIAQVFRVRNPDASLRVRLRVEIGRLRSLLSGLARIEASAEGFVLSPLDDAEVVVLLPPIEGDQAALLALLADGAAWSTSALAQVLGASQRTVQRALVELQAEGKVRSIGRARTQRWLSPPLAGFTTNLLLPAALPLS